MIYKKLSYLFFIILATAICQQLNAQVSGIVFKDFNFNGKHDSTVIHNEPGIANITVKAYNKSDLLIATKHTNQYGRYSFDATEILPNQPVRLEFETTHINSQYQTVSNAKNNSDASAIRFVKGGDDNVHLGLANADWYIEADSAKLVVPIYRYGNPLGTANAANVVQPNDSSALVIFNYNNSGTNNHNNTLATAAQIGSVFGVAVSKYSGIIYAGAVLKRHTGLGPGNGNYKTAPGSIYQINTATNEVSLFTTLDSTLWQSITGTHNEANIFDALHVLPNFGTGSLHRGLISNVQGKSNDARAFDQIGKVGLGGLEMHSNGKYLYVINLYKKQLVQIDLQNKYQPIKPSSVAQFKTWSLPSLSVAEQAKGQLRPWALKFHNNKLYIGAVNDAQISQQTNDLKAFVFEFDPATEQFATVLSFPLNYQRSSPNPAGSCVNRTSWYAWTNSFRICNGSENVYPQPMLTDIEFDAEDAMILNFSDRTGYQGGASQRSLTGTTLYNSFVNGDILRAYKNIHGQFEIEVNAKEGYTTTKAPTLGMNNNEGIENGEFYWGDGDADNDSMNGEWHPDNAGGSMAYLPGSTHIATTFVDPINFASNGIAKLNNNTGALEANKSYEVYNNATHKGTHHKTHGLGDLELIPTLAPIEVGNRVWYDKNYNGLQDANETPIANIKIALYTDPNNDGNTNDGVLIGTTTTDDNGNWIFTTGKGDNEKGRFFNAALTPHTHYVARLADIYFDTTGTALTNILGGNVTKTIKTFANKSGAGLADQTDNDAETFFDSTINLSYYQISFTTEDWGSSNHSLDFGLAHAHYTLSNEQLQLAIDYQTNQQQLKWQYQGNALVTQYEILISNDGVAFKKLAKSSQNSYNLSYTIHAKYAQVKATTIDGKTIISNTVVLQNKKQNSIKLSSVNTQQLTLHINASSSGQNKIEVYTEHGQLVHLLQTQLMIGSNTVPINTSSLAQGIYIIRSAGIVNDAIKFLKTR